MLLEGGYVMKSKSALLAMFLSVSAINASAGDFDGSKALICATVEAHACDPGLECKRSLPSDLGAPKFLSLDFQKKVVVGPAHTTPMLVFRKEPEQVVMEGTENGYAWTIVLDSTDGSMTLMLASSGDALVLFGNCTAL